MVSQHQIWRQELPAKIEKTLPMSQDPLIFIIRLIPAAISPNSLQSTRNYRQNLKEILASASWLLPRYTNYLGFSDGINAREIVKVDFMTEVRHVTRVKAVRVWIQPQRRDRSMCDSRGTLEFRFLGQTTRGKRNYTKPWVAISRIIKTN